LLSVSAETVLAHGRNAIPQGSEAARFQSAEVREDLTELRGAAYASADAYAELLADCLAELGDLLPPVRAFAGADTPNGADNASANAAAEAKAFLMVASSSRRPPVNITVHDLL